MDAIFPPYSMEAECFKEDLAALTISRAQIEIGYAKVDVLQAARK